MKKKNTRLRLLETGAELIHAQGYHNTGIQEILKAAKVPKGSFYFYFKSKEAFCLALIDHFGAQMKTRMETIFNDPDLAPLQKLRQFFSSTRRYFKDQEFKNGCPIGNLSLELGGNNAMVRPKLQAALENMEGRLAKCLDEARQAGDLPRHIDVQEMAAFILNSWEGALVRMKASKSMVPLRLFEKAIFSMLIT